jgi:hypothetical protein
MVNRNNILGDISLVQRALETSPIRLGQLDVDPITADQQARYQSEGLTYISNNTSIIPRDTAGNILLEESSTSNPLLIIDPVAELITTKSALKVLDTRFQYYKFPVTIKPSADIEDLVVDLDFESDTIAARFTIPAGIDAQGQPQTLQRIATSKADNWFTNGGQSTQGTSRLPFAGGNQSEIGSYTITPDVLEALRAKNKTLRFTIQAQFLSSVSDTTEFVLTLGRSIPEQWRSTGTTYRVRSESNGQFGPNEYPYFKFDYVVDIFNDAAPYDKYSIGVSANKRAWVLTENCYWKIDVIDIPTTPSLNGDIGTGVYSLSEGGNSILSEIKDSGATITDIYKLNNGQLISLPEYTLDNSQTSARNPMGNVSEDIDETYPPYGDIGYPGEVREYEDDEGIVIAYFEWDGFYQTWNEVEQ